MRMIVALAAIGLGLAVAAEAWADDLPCAVEAGEMNAMRGGADISDSLLMSNDSALNGSNTGSISLDHATKSSGTIHDATVMGNHGITAVMQNTGDLVNMNNATSVNVYMH